MGECYKIFYIESWVRNVSHGKPGPWADPHMSIDIPSEAEQRLDDILNPYDLNSSAWMRRMEYNMNHKGQTRSWAMIAFPQEYRLAGHFCSIRSSSDDLPFTYYSLNRNDSASKTIPLLSYIWVNSKDSLQQTAGRTPMLQSAWNLLQDKEQDSNWLCFSDPLPDDWVKKCEEGDDDLYRKTKFYL